MCFWVVNSWVRKSSSLGARRALGSLSGFASPGRASGAAEPAAHVALGGGQLLFKSPSICTSGPCFAETKLSMRISAGCIQTVVAESATVIRRGREIGARPIRNFAVSQQSPADEHCPQLPHLLCVRFTPPIGLT